MIGQMQRREVDFSASIMSITYDRSLVMDFSIPFMEAISTLIGHQRHFERTSVNWTGFLVQKSFFQNH